MVTRRSFLTAGGLCLAGLAVPRRGIAQGVVIEMRAEGGGADVWFDPIGVLIAPGQTVRWVVREDVHTTTAYHPKNESHSLRIPEGAEPWDSGFLVQPGKHFEVKLTVEGVYDYYCMPHEEAGMVGRIIVGKPGGAGALPFDYFKGKPGTTGWKTVPPEAQKAFPSVADIMRLRTVKRTKRS